MTKFDYAYFARHSVANGEAQMTRAPMVELSPGELARLLGLVEEDGVLISVGIVRLPQAWVDEWKTRTGPLELTFSDIALLTGLSVGTLYGWRRKKLLNCRATGSTGYRVSPAELARRMREIQTGHGCAPVAVESPTQLAERGRLAKERARAAIRGDRW